MNKNKIANILFALNNADTVKIDGEVSVIDTDKIIGQGDNEVVYASYDDDDAQEFRIRFTEQGLSDAIIHDNKITCEDSDGDKTVITLFQTVPLNINKS